MCGGGGGDGAAEYDALARKREADRQARIRAVIGKINRVFKDSGRKDLYREQRQAVRQEGNRQLRQKSADQGRQLGFALARSGLGGGSVDVESRARFDRNKDEEALEIERAARSAAGSLKDADARSKNALISQAVTGISATQAAKNAQEALGVNAAVGRSQDHLSNLGDLMSGIALAYGQGQQGVGISRGLAAFPQWGGYGATSPGTYRGSGSGYSGTTTSIG